MKAYLFIETGEERPPKRGEWYDNRSIVEIKKNAPEQITFCDSDFPKSVTAQIFTRHEIDIPREAIDLIVEPWSQKGYISLMRYRAPIPRPKRKVKKWIYEFANHGVTWRSTVPLSEAEYGKQPMMGHKVLETEIEVEE